MEEFKSLEELCIMDAKHKLMGAICGRIPDLLVMHKFLSQELLNDEAPDDLKGQFNVAKNMALYSYFFYSLAPEVHLKTYTLIEHALRIKANTNKKLGLKKLLTLAIEKRWVSDAGFRHLKNSTNENEWCDRMISSIPSLRNSMAHGSNLLTPDCLHHISCCADFINQLFPKSDLDKNSNK